MLVLVAIGLAATTLTQFRPLARGRTLLDTLALVPEWRFYAQASIREAAVLARDPLLVIRDRDGGGERAGEPGGWRPLRWFPERRLIDALWNPQGRVDEPLLAMAEDLADAFTDDPAAEVVKSLRYLVLLRAAMAAPADPPVRAGTERQFAVVHAIGRGARDMRIAFVSTWHRW